MEESKVAQGENGLSEAHATALAAKLEGFWMTLSAQEQAHLNTALTRLIEEGPEVTGYVAVEQPVFLGLILIAILPITPSNPSSH